MQVFTPFTPGLGVQFGPRTDLQPPTGVPPQFLRPQGSNQQSQLCRRGDWEPCDPQTVQIQSTHELRDTRKAHHLCGAMPWPHSVIEVNPKTGKQKIRGVEKARVNLKKKKVLIHRSLRDLSAQKWGGSINPMLFQEHCLLFYGTLQCNTSNTTWRWPCQPGLCSQQDLLPASLLLWGITALQSHRLTQQYQQKPVM